MLPVEQMTWVGKIVICPVDSTITEQRTSHLSAYSRSGTQLYSSDHAASSTVDVNVLLGTICTRLLTFAYATALFASTLLYKVRTVN